MGDVVRGLRQALVMLLVSAVAALVVAGLWSALQGGGFRSKVGIALMVIAGLISLTGGTAFSRAADYEERAFLGMGADRDEPDTGEGLTGLASSCSCPCPCSSLAASSSARADSCRSP